MALGSPTAMFEIVSAFLSKLRESSRACTPDQHRTD